MTELSVIIVSHGHEAMLLDCIGSLGEALRDVASETVLLNNLPDGKVEALLRPVFPDVIYMNNPSPVGFADNVNRASKACAGKHLLILNPDTVYQSGSIAGAIDYLEQYGDVALLGCRLMNDDGSVQQNYRRFPTLPVILSRGLGADHWPWQPHFYRWRMMLDATFDRPTPVDWVFGAFMLVRRSWFDAVGGMDPDFNLYYEDVDLCYRLRARGLKTVFYPELQFGHRHLRSSARKPLGKAWRWHVRSAYRILRKHGYLLRPPVELEPH